jgi:hypothetical protein
MPARLSGKSARGCCVHCYLFRNKERSSPSDHNGFNSQGEVSDVFRSQRYDCGRSGYIKRICGRVGLGRSYAAERAETALAAR